MFLKFMQKIVYSVLVFVVCSGQSFGQFTNGPIDFRRQFSGAMPVAIYSGIKANDFKKLIVASFEKSNFALVSIKETSAQSTVYNFSYSIVFEGKSQTISITTRSYGDIDSLNRCSNCFLWDTKFTDENSVRNLPWMVQYELNRKLFADIDSAYEKIKISGQKYMDQKHGFDYRSQVREDRNFSPYGNSYSGVEFATLKREVIQAYSNAGFNFTNEKARDASYTYLSFSFPITEDKKDGVVYAVSFFSQLNSDAFCAPCEMTESYNPYQQLPSAGGLGISDRLTLESRFSAARTRAFELLKSSTARYLRPRTDFVIPPKHAPLGSPRPYIPPPPPT
jgi:hypothetical protein